MKYYLQLMRPANLVTALADILAGIAITKYNFSVASSSIVPVFLLSISTIGLYGGGVVFNDIFDAELDKIERRERAIPSGKVTIFNAGILGIILLVVGVVSAFFVSLFSGLIACFIAIMALVYDKWGKHNYYLGPINMGLCRGANLLLGVSISLSGLLNYWWLAFLPILYIAAITMISRGEVHGSTKNILLLSGFLYLIVNLSQLFTSFTFGNLLITFPFVLLHIWLIFRPLITAIKNPIAPNIGKAVKAGVISLIVMDAAWVAVSGNLLLAFFVLLLLPISAFWAKKFAVT